MNLKQCREEYARLLVLGGIRLKQGERVIICSDVKLADMAELVAKTAYQNGASKVEIQWNSARLEAYGYEYANLEYLQEVDKWEEERLMLQVEQLPCVIFLVSSETIPYTEAMLTSQMSVRVNRLPVLRKYREQMDGKYKWTLGGVPTQEWADQVFPGEEGNLDHLWRSILKTVMITGDGSSIEKWDAKWVKTRKNVDFLNSLNLKSIRVKTSLGTDLTMELSPDVLWEGGADHNLGHAPNLPSEEIYTSPIAGKAEGVMISSKPLVCHNQIVSGIKLVFKEGKVVEVKAEEGEDFFRRYLQTDEGASMLGEIAIVDRFSPIKEPGHLFYHTLYDENVACHIAVGRGFPFLLKDFANMTPEEIGKAGLNTSGIHCDIMFGTIDTEITGITADGKEVQIMADAKWCN